MPKAKCWGMIKSISRLTSQVLLLRNWVSAPLFQEFQKCFEDTLRHLNAMAPQPLTPEAPSRFFETTEPAATTKAFTFDVWWFVTGIYTYIYMCIYIYCKYILYIYTYTAYSSTYQFVIKVHKLQAHGSWLITLHLCFEHHKVYKN